MDKNPAPWCKIKLGITRQSFIVRHSIVIRQFNVPFPNYSQICKPNYLQKSIDWTFYIWSGCRIFVRDCTCYYL